MYCLCFTSLPAFSTLKSAVKGNGPFIERLKETEVLIKQE
jgi:hypothetical protein